VSGLLIREAQPTDAALVFDFITALAEYEKLAQDVVTNEREIAARLFGPSPRVFCDIAERHGAPAGIALWFYNFSTFRGRHGIYLEDLFVKPEMRSHGIGKALLVNLARRAVAQNCARVEWSVLDWNTPSVDFYKALGAVPMDEWTTFRLTGDALTKLAGA
jgi:GNAT superfamily N-acetyltransferase